LKSGLAGEHVGVLAADQRGRRLICATSLCAACSVSKRICQPRSQPAPLRALRGVELKCPSEKVHGAVERECTRGSLGGNAVLMSSLRQLVRRGEMSGKHLRIDGRRRPPEGVRKPRVMDTPGIRV
jgi:hypothetical protein